MYFRPNRAPLRSVLFSVGTFQVGVIDEDEGSGGDLDTTAR